MRSIIPQPTLRIVVAIAATETYPRDTGKYVAKAFGLELEGGAYLADITPNDQIDFRSYADGPPPALDLDGAWHTLVVALVDRDVSDAWLAWFDGVVPQAQESGGRHKVIAFATDETTQDRLVERGSKLAKVQLNLASKFGEKALRPAILGLIVINEGRRLVAEACDPRFGTHLKLFISHAKTDGLPLALAIKNQIPMIPRLGKFYDDSELLISGDWSEDLERNVAQSTVVIVRTDQFDGRPACRDEALWASHYACPVLVVDARQSLLIEESDLGIGDVPTVKLPDGNVYRALHAALWVGLRGLCVARAVRYLEQADAFAGVPVRVLHRSPTFGAIRRLCDKLATDGGRDSDAILVHPSPDLDGQAGEPFRVFAKHHLSGVRLVTVDRLLAEAGLA
ncbi:MAG: hypothetical protein GY711_24895 [bacterium]|nr:hypothetical protein [bacterium]